VRREKLKRRQLVRSLTAKHMEMMARLEAEGSGSPSLRSVTWKM
jgi:hypothetical protein